MPSAPLTGPEVSTDPMGQGLATSGSLILVSVTVHGAPEHLSARLYVRVLPSFRMHSSLQRFTGPNKGHGTKTALVEERHAARGGEGQGQVPRGSTPSADRPPTHPESSQGLLSGSSPNSSFRSFMEVPFHRRG